MDNTTQKFETWAVIELFGHQQLAGLVTEASIGGCSFVRVDVPEINGRPAFTKFYGNGAIYSMTPVGEAEARMALANIMPRPVSVYLIPERSSAIDYTEAHERTTHPEDYEDDEDERDATEYYDDEDDDEDEGDIPEEIGIEDAARFNAEHTIAELDKEQ